ncbi:MAG: menaquinone biosynthesis protein [Planctomycetota bacterium]|nr:menaquinone biosynthesis protein [Planctomycetota bacterium]
MKLPAAKPASSSAWSAPRRGAFRIGSVSYLNAKPLIHGLEEQVDLDLRLDVPARLMDRLGTQEFDVALLPVIDYQRLANLKIVPSGGIGCDGPTLTVRIFSSCPISQIEILACDMESHTSVALARIILAESFGTRPEIVELTGANEDESASAARLLIGDKVVCQPSAGKYQLDLGAAWKELTAMPFVFAVWTARGGIDLGDLPLRLSEARLRGMDSLPEIVARHAVPRGWPAELAMEYMSKYLKYEIGPAQLAAIHRFHELAHVHGIIPAPRPLQIY